MKSDSQLKQDVMDELAWEPAINETEIGVEVKNGIVTLNGHLSSYAEKLAAEKAALRVADVKGLAVEIDVKLPGSSTRNDADIARAAKNALEWDTFVPKDDVKVMVEGGWITLSGTVDRDYQRKSAEAAVRNLMGVKGVSNIIALKPAVQPRDVKKKIESSLYRHAHLDAQAIVVTINGGQVTLTGKVPSWFERTAASQAAWAAPGVTDVVNKILVAS